MRRRHAAQRARGLLLAYGRLAREERERQGLTQLATAERARIGVRHLRDIEHGRANRFLTLVDLAELGLDRAFSELMEAAERTRAGPTSG